MSFCRMGLIVALVLSLHGALVAQKPVVSTPYPASPDHPTPAWFVDVAAHAGITVRDVNGSVKNKRYILETTGSGVAIIDYNRDGWPDIFIVNGSELP